MSHATIIKRRAILLRSRGYSIKEVESKLNISRSTASLWLRNVTLSSKAIERLKKRSLFGQYKTRAVILEKSEKQHSQLIKEINKMLLEVKMTKSLSKVFCSLIYYCEGNKQTGYVRFTNSDPTLIRLFVFLFRNGFNVDESKFRALVHLHEYHVEKRQKMFWSKLTNIPLVQFHKSYLKPHTAIRKHENYPGCIAISYFDSRIAKELLAIYNTFYKGVSVNW